MAKFKDYCEQISEEEYRALDRPSYSFFKELGDVGPSVIRDGIDFKSSTSLTLGSLVDNLLTQENYDPLSEYRVTKIVPDLSGTTHHSKILKHIHDNRLLEVNEKILKDICENLGFKRNPSFTDKKFEIQLNMVVSMLNGTKYIQERDYQLALQMADVIKYHEYTKDIINPSFDVEVVNQAIILFKLKGLPVKGMLDRINIDHENKIISPYDLKTGYHYNFLENFWKYRYYLQASMYSAAIYYILANSDEFEGYKVEPFRFIYISREKPDIPLIYEVPHQFIEYGMEGWTTVTGRKYKGVVELVEDYKWYVENEEYNLTREIVENNGKITINVPKI